MNDSNFSEIFYLDPNSIQINRSKRQRTEIDVLDIIDSIRQNGIINPIIIQREEIKNELTNGITYYVDELIAGERRLEACKQLNIKVPCRLFSSLSPIDSQIIELEENLKRKDLPWRDNIQAIGNLYTLYLKQNPQQILSQNLSQVSKLLSIPEGKLKDYLYVFDNQNEKILSFAENLTQAVSLLSKFKAKKTENLKNNIQAALSQDKSIPEYLKPPQRTSKPPITHNTSELTITPENNSPILNTSFLDWINNKNHLNQKRFNLFFCDFPQSPKNFWVIFNSFFGNLNDLLDTTAHVLLWFDMNNYSQIIDYVAKTPLSFEPHPFIWYKSNIESNQRTQQPPKSIYESCLILSHNSRPFLKQIHNAYHTPRATQPICPNQKSLSMLRYLLSTFVDETTNIFDPTCGSGSSLIISEELNAKSILGLEISPERCEKANEKLTRSRELRKLLEK